MQADRRRRRLTDLALVGIAAVLTFVSFPTAWAPELSLWWTIWFSHVPLLWVLRDKAPRQAFWWGTLCGTLINAGGYYWIAELLQTFGHLPRPVAWLGLWLHSFYQGLMWGIWAWLINRIGNTTRVPLEWSAPLAMVAVEIALPRLFPAYMGNSQYPFPLVMQVVDLFGITAVTFLVYRVNATLYLWFRTWREGRTRPLRATWVTAGMVGATLIYGGVRIVQLDARAAEAPKLKVGMVEGDIGIFEKETAERRRDHLLVQQRLSRDLEQQGAQLIVWPESAYRYTHLPRDMTQFPPATAPLVKDAEEDRRLRTSPRDRAAPQRGFSTPLLFGGTSTLPRDEPRWEGDFPVTPYNTAWLLDGEGNVVGAYDKVYLLMFGEYIPYAQYIPWIYKWIPAAGNLEPGARIEVIEADLWGLGPIRLGVIICYEGILPAFTRQFAEKSPHVLINLTNDDWFGKTAERYLHLALTVPRAIEHRLAFVRSTLTGVSAFVDPVGRMVMQTKPTDPETLLWDVPLLQSRTVYQVIGDAFAYACLLLTLGFYGWGRWRRR